MKNMRKTNETLLKRPIPGTYRSEIVSAEFDPGYAANGAFKVIYVLENDKKQLFDFSEIFYNEPGATRTWDFIDTIEEYGADSENFVSFVGFKEIVNLQYVLSNGKRYLNITSRAPIGFERKEEDANGVED